MTASPRDNLKVKAAHFLESRPFESLIVFLVLADVLFVAIEAGVEERLLCFNGKVVPYGSPAGNHLSLMHERAPPTSADGGAQRGRGGAQLAPDKPQEKTSLLNFGSDVVAHTFAGEDPPVLVCSSKHSEKVEHVLHFCHMASIAILTIFVVEQAIKWWAIPGYMGMWQNRLDAFVVTFSLFIDTVVIAYVESKATETQNAERQEVTLMIVMILMMLSRVWRVVRICHGIWEEYVHVEEEIEKPKEENAKLRQVLQRLGVDPDKELEKMSESCPAVH